MTTKNKIIINLGPCQAWHRVTIINCHNIRVWTIEVNQVIREPLWTYSLACRGQEEVINSWQTPRVYIINLRWHFQHETPVILLLNRGKLFEIKMFHHNSAKATDSPDDIYLTYIKFNWLNIRLLVKYTGNYDRKLRICVCCFRAVLYDLLLHLIILRIFSWRYICLCMFNKLGMKVL